MTTPIDHALKITKIHQQIVTANKPTLLFSNVHNTNFPLITNLFSTSHHTKLTFNKRPQQLIHQLIKLIETTLPPTPTTL